MQLQAVLRRAAVQATLAPSLYNTQPWRILLSHDRMRLSADPDRQLPIHDPSGRQLLISCGCALLNARASIAADGVDVEVRRFPDGVLDGQPLAVLTPVGAEAGSADGAELARLAKVTGERHTNRLHFDPGGPDERVMGALRKTAAHAGAGLVPLDGPEQRHLIGSLHRDAGMIVHSDAGYVAEHRAWARPAGIGVAAGASGIQLDEAWDVIDSAPRLMVLTTARDTPQAWLSAGEALERLLLYITAEGYVAGLSSQVTQVPVIRARMRSVLAMDDFPQLLLQIGSAPVGVPTRRRRLVDVMSEVGSSEYGGDSGGIG